MKKTLMGADLGTTALKTVVFSVEGKELASATVEYPLITPAPDYVEADPDVYWDSFFIAVKNLAEQIDLSSIAAIGFSAQGETLIPVDADGVALRNAIVWMDNRAKEEALYLKTKFTNQACYRKCGQVSFEPTWPASKILWLRKNEPNVFAKTKKFLLLEDYFIAKLTGNYVSEGSLLTSTAYWDINTKKYWPEMLDELGISTKQLPDIMESGEAVGRLLPQPAKALGLPETAIICTGALDQAAGAIGVGNIRDGLFSDNIGAAMAICAFTREFALDPNAVMPVHYFPIENTYMVHSFTSGGMNLRWFRDAFCQLEMSVSALTGEADYAILDKEAARVVPGCEGMIMLPHLAGSMPPDMNANARGVFYGFSLNHKKPHFVRAIMESLGFILRRNIEAIEKMGISVSEVRSLGGGSHSKIWNQIKADIIGRPIVTFKCKEAASLGAAILAGKATGIYQNIEEACKSMVQVDERFEPKHETRAVYDLAYLKYCKLFSDLTELFDM